MSVFAQYCYLLYNFPCNYRMLVPPLTKAHLCHCVANLIRVYGANLFLELTNLYICTDSPMPVFYMRMKSM